MMVLGMEGALGSTSRDGKGEAATGHEGSYDRVLRCMETNDEFACALVLSIICEFGINLEARRLLLPNWSCALGSEFLPRGLFPTMP